MWLFYILSGLVGGIIAGMGLGGGTILIPLLTIFLGIDQKVAQGINLLTFIPTAITSCIIHQKNKLLNFKMFFIIAIPAVIFAVLAALLVKKLESDILKYIFGAFMIVLAIYELVMAIINSIKIKNLFNKTKFLL